MGSQSAYQSNRLQQSERKRLAILKVAGHQFARRGYSASRVSDIAEQAGVSKGLVFHFFGNKERLFEAVLEDCLVRWSALIDYQVSGKCDDAREELRAIYLASFDYLDNNPVLRLFQRRDEPMLEAYQSDIERRNIQWRKRVLGIIKRGITENSIQSGQDPARLAAIFHELQGALMTGAMVRGSATRHDRKTIEMAIDIFLSGISR